MSEESKKKVVVQVAPRQDFKGWFAAGRFWPEGETEAELSDADIAKLKGRPGVVILDAEKLSARIPDEKPKAAAPGPTKDAGKK